VVGIDKDLISIVENAIDKKMSQLNQSSFPNLKDQLETIDRNIEMCKQSLLNLVMNNGKGNEQIKKKPTLFLPKGRSNHEANVNNDQKPKNTISKKEVIDSLNKIKAYMNVMNISFNNLNTVIFGSTNENKPIDKRDL
jgi:hypothetical protein